MSEVKKLSQLSSASSLDGLSLLATDSGGNARRVKPELIPQKAYVISTEQIMDLNEATSPGIWLLNGETNPLNCPPGKNFVVGMLEVFHRYNSNILFQRMIGYQGDMATRCLFKGSWSAWHCM